MNARIVCGTAALAGTAILVGQMSGAENGRGRSGPRGGNVLAGQDVYDVDICALGSLDQKGKVGSFPDGTVGLALSTTGHNSGNVELPWFPSPKVHHPVIAQNMYRVNADGRLEQIGMAWLKHAWFAVQGTSCGDCQSSGTGTRLGVGCADTYGSINNAQQYWLGPREEVKPHKHVWMDGISNTGSHFARNPEGGDSDPHNQVEHRLRVRMGDLTDPGAMHFYEGVYYLMRKLDSNNWANVIEQPEHLDNNMAHREVVPTMDQNEDFDFTDVGPERIGGPIVYTWADLTGGMAEAAVPIDDGLVHVGSRAVDEGNGRHRYEYAVFNFNLDRQISEFSVPVPDGVNVTDVGFHAPFDGYRDENGTLINEVPGYDTAAWTTTRSNGQLTWSAPNPEGQAEPNTLRYASTYTFWFTADLEPGVPVTAALTPHLPGNVGSLTVNVLAPLGEKNIADITEIFVKDGTHLQGGVNKVLNSDDNYYRAFSEYGFSAFEPNVLEVRVTAFATQTSPDSLCVAVESHIDNPSGVSKILFKNWNTLDWDLLHTYAVTATDMTEIVGGFDASTYVKPSGKIKLGIRQIVFITFSPLGFETFIDLIELGTN